jgi:L-ascorbate metabolism protein UlaG (beta-lactamase superfamily)
MKTIAILMLLWPLAARAEVTLTYLGAAGWQLDDGKTVVLVDPFFTRKHGRKGAPISPDEAEIDRHTPPRVDWILVEHSHADHLMDVPSIAKKRHARVMGTLSTTRVARAGGVAVDHLVPVGGGEDLELGGGLSVRVIPGLHSRLDDFQYFDAHREIPEGISLPMPEENYLEGGTLNYLVRIGGRQILVISSANYIARELDGLRPDAVIVALGHRDRIHDYTCGLMRLLGQPKLVLATHFDDCYGPIDAPIEISAEDRRFPDEVHACSRASQVILPAHFQKISVSSATVGAATAVERDRPR